MTAPDEPSLLGLADHPLEQIAERVLGAWDDFLDLAAVADLSAPSRLPGWSGSDVLIHLGTWDDTPPMARLLASARSGGSGPVPQPDADNAAMVHRHRGAPRDEVLAALAAGRAGIEQFLGSADATEWGRAAAASAVGPLPVLGQVQAGCYELAVHAADLQPCGAPPASTRLQQAGLAALLDVTGSLAAAHEVHLTLTAQTPDGGWRFTSGGTGWSTEPVAAGPVAGTGVHGTAADLLDASAGRAALPALLVSRRLVVHSLPSWLRLAPLLDSVPALPGGPALRTAVTGLSGVGRVVQAVGRLPAVPLLGRRRGR